MMIVNDDSRVINKLEVSLTEDARVIFYDCHMFIVQATGLKRVSFIEKPNKALSPTRWQYQSQV
jgi:hypothetical protein